MKNSKIKAGFIAVVGYTNVGKSSLINCLINEKLAIVSNKVQTTRKNMKYILTSDDFQMIFVDTPGYFEKAYNKLDEFLLKQIEDIFKHCDVYLLVIAPDTKDFSPLLSTLNAKKHIIVINKIDLYNDTTLKNYKNLLISKGIENDNIVMVSSLKRKNINKLITRIKTLLPESNDFLFDPELISIEKTKDIVEEFIRETLYETLKDELPYSCGISIEEMHENNTKKTYIRALIFCEKESQKRIIIGSNGKMLKKIGVISRKKIEDFLDKPVFLDLWIKVYKNWRKRVEIMKYLGYAKS